MRGRFDVLRAVGLRLGGSRGGRHLDHAAEVRLPPTCTTGWQWKNRVANDHVGAGPDDGRAGSGGWPSAVGFRTCAPLRGRCRARARGVSGSSCVRRSLLSFAGLIVSTRHVCGSRVPMIDSAAGPGPPVRGAPRRRVRASDQAARTTAGSASDRADARRGAARAVVPGRACGLPASPRAVDAVVCCPTPASGPWSSAVRFEDDRGARSEGFAPPAVPWTSSTTEQRLELSGWWAGRERRGGARPLTPVSATAPYATARPGAGRPPWNSFAAPGSSAEIDLGSWGERPGTGGVAPRGPRRGRAGWSVSRCSPRSTGGAPSPGSFDSVRLGSPTRARWDPRAGH